MEREVSVYEGNQRKRVQLMKLDSEMMKNEKYWNQVLVFTYGVMRSIEMDAVPDFSSLMLM